MWLGGNLNVFYVVNGAVVISMGLSFAQSLLAIIVGNLAFLAVGFTSMQGPRTGTSTFAVSRASYGPNGGRFLAFFNWVTCVGFEASGLALVVLAALAICSRAGAGESTYTWSVSSGSLPPGLHLNSINGAISGTPLVPGTANFTVQVSDAENPPVSASASFGITIARGAHPALLSGSYPER